MPTVRVTARPAYEFLLSLVAYLTPERVDSYEVGPGWFQAAGASLPTDAASDVEALFCGCEHMVVRLLDVARRLPAPGEPAALIGEIEELDPREVRLTLLGYFARRSRQRVPPQTIAAAADGDREAGLTLVRDNSDGPECERGLRSVLAMSDAEATGALLRVLRAWNERVFEPHVRPAWPIIEREADRLRGRATELAQEAFLAEVTNGADVAPAPGLDEIELFPTWVLRPWNIFCEQERTLMLGVGVLATQTSDDPDAPPDRLVRLARALGDERRLRILHRLLGGSYTLQELAEDLGTPKTTLLHHLVILRSVGIVQVGRNAQGRYSLRPGIARELHTLLDGYLPAIPRPAEEEARLLAPR